MFSSLHHGQLQNASVKSCLSDQSNVFASIAFKLLAELIIFMYMCSLLTPDGAKVLLFDKDNVMHISNDYF